MVHGMTPSGDVVGGIVAMWKGRIRMRATSGISELPGEPVGFDGTLTGVRNPDRTVQLRLTADIESLTVALKGPNLPSDWSTRFDVAHVEEAGDVVRADWTLAPANAAPTHLFELGLWRDLTIAVDLGPP